MQTLVKIPALTPLRIIAFAIAALVVLVVAVCIALLIAMASGKKFEFDGRPYAAQLLPTLERALGRAVTIDGDIRISLSDKPRIEISKLRLHNPDGFKSITAARDFGTIDYLVLEVDAPAFVRGQMIVKELSGDGAHFHLMRNAQGLTNWVFDPDVASKKPAEVAGKRAKSESATKKVSVEKLALTKITVELTDEGKPTHRFDLIKLLANGGDGVALKVSGNGLIENKYPYLVRFEGTGPTETLDKLLNGSTPFLLDGGVEFLGSTLTASGQLEPLAMMSLAQKEDAKQTRTKITLALGAPDVREVERFLGANLPDFGAIAFVGEVHREGKNISVKNLNAVLGQSQIVGDLNWDGRKLGGALTAQVFDMAPLLKSDQKVKQSKTLSEWYLGLADAQFDLGLLKSIDTELSLRVEKWLSMPGDVQQTEIKINIKDGALNSPLRVQFAGVQLQGDLSVNNNEFEFVVGADNSPLGRIAEVFFGFEGMEGQLGGLAMRANAVGTRARDLANTMNARLVLANGKMKYGKQKGSKPVDFDLNSLTFVSEPGLPTTIDTSVKLLGQEVSGTVKTLPLNSILTAKSFAFELDANSKSIKGKVKGSMEPGGRNTNLHVDLRAANTADFRQWVNKGKAQSQIEASTQVKLPIHIAGRVKANKAGWQWQGEKAELAKMGFNIVAASDKKGITSKIEANTISVPDLEAFFASLVDKQNSKPGAIEKAKTDAQASIQTLSSGNVRAVNLDLPILPKGISLKNTNIVLKIGQIVGSRVDARDVNMQIDIRDGHLLPSPFSMTALGVNLTGAIALDLRPDVPTLEWWLQADNAKLAQALTALNLSDQIQIDVGSMTLHAAARGDTLGKLLERGELVADIGETKLAWRDPNTNASASFHVSKADLKALPGQPIALNLLGTMDVPSDPSQVPMHLTVTSGRLDDLLDPKQRLPIKIDLSVLEHQLELTGSLARNLKERELTMNMNLSGTRMDKLDPLVRAALPPWGPYTMQGQLKVGPNGYEIPAVTLAVGKKSQDQSNEETALTKDNAGSYFKGQAKFLTNTTPANVSVDLQAQRIRLEDFDINQWSAFKKPEDATKPVDKAKDAVSVDAIKKQAESASNKAEQFLSEKTLRRLNANISIKVDEVSSGADNLGRGTAQFQLLNGQAQVGPVNLESPAGKAFMQLDFSPVGEKMDARLQLKTDQFDYGLLARRIDPKTDVYGRLSLDLDVAATAPHISELMQTGSGNIAFKVWPEKIKAGVFDLWATNIFMSMADKVDSKSKINCGAGNFSLVEGELWHRELWLDTTKVRVKGAAHIDLKDESLALRVVPTPKEAQFFSLATPVEVTGSIRDYHVGAKAGDIFSSIGGFLTSWISAPFKKLSGAKTLPADGADVCAPPLPAITANSNVSLR